MQPHCSQCRANRVAMWISCKGCHTRSPIFQPVGWRLFYRLFTSAFSANLVIQSWKCNPIQQHIPIGLLWGSTSKGDWTRTWNSSPWIHQSNMSGSLLCLSTETYSLQGHGPYFFVHLPRIFVPWSLFLSTCSKCKNDYRIKSVSISRSPSVNGFFSAML